jgi:hypothetical protein
MLKILRSNPLISLVFPVLLAIGIWCGSYMIHGNFLAKSGMPMFDVFWGWLLKMPAISLFTGFSILILEAFTWNTFINRESLLKQSTNLPALFFIILSSCRPMQIAFYPSLLASLFLILAIRRLAESYKKEKALSEAFDSGFLIGIASLFYLPASVFLIFLWIALLSMRSIVWREWIVSFIGFVLPILFALVYYSIFLSPEDFWYDKLIRIIGIYKPMLTFSWKQVFMLSALGLIGIVSLLLFLRKIPDNVVKNQKIWTLMIWFASFAIIAGIFSPQKDSRSFSLLAIPGSFIFSNYFLRARYTWLTELLFLILLAAIAVNIFY